jgi:hypothetical protein
MSKRPRAPDAPDIHTLAMMLDYAIIEGAELRLPLFVLLLRAARLELMNCIGADGAGTIESRPQLTLPRALAALDEAPASSPVLLQDR